MTNFCTSCGAVLKPDSRFCEACGAPKPLEAESAAPSRAAPSPVPTVQTRRSTFMVAAVGALVVIVALAVGGYVIWTKQKEAEAEALRVEQTRLAEVHRQQEEAQQRQQELERRLQEEAELRMKAEKARLEAVAVAAAEAEARRGAEERARAEAQARALDDAARAKAAAERRAADQERDLSARSEQRSISGAYRAASQAARRGDNASAVSACQRSAQEGDAHCQYLIGTLYATGKVGKRSEAELRLAADLLGKAANQGLALAQVNFGLMNERGLGVPRDVDAAIGWYKKAANQGDSNAQQALARLSAK